MSSKLANTDRMKQILKDLEGQHERNGMPRVGIVLLAERLDPRGLHVVSPIMLHNDVEVRCLVMCKVQGTRKPHTLYLDVPLDKFNALPEVKPEDC